MNNLLAASNSRFDSGLMYWTGDGAYLATDGFPRAGCASLDDGEHLDSTPISVTAGNPYTLYVFAKIDDGATLTVTHGAQTVATFTGALAGAQWVEYSLPFAPDASQVLPFVFTAGGGAVLLDSVTVIAGVLPVTRSGVASTVARMLRSLATDAGLSLTPVASGSEGDYSHAVDEALRSIGAIDRYGTPDVTLVDFDQVSDVIAAAHAAMLKSLRADYALETDVTLGPRTERRSQIAGNIDGMIGGDGDVGGRVHVRAMKREGGWER